MSQTANSILVPFLLGNGVWDTYYAIGLLQTDNGPLWPSGVQTDELTPAPGTPGPNSDPWGPANPQNMAAVVPPTLSDPGDPPGGPQVVTPQTVAGNFAIGVLAMRLTVLNGGELDPLSSFQITTVEDGMSMLRPNTPIPAPGALALLGLAGLAGTRRRRRA